MTVQFIELTDLGGWSTAYAAAGKFVVNPAHIVSAYPMVGFNPESPHPDRRVRPHTLLTLTAGATFNVAETPDEIAALCGLAVRRPYAPLTPASPDAHAAALVSDQGESP